MYIKCQTESIGRPCAIFEFDSFFIKAEETGKKWQKNIFSPLTAKVASGFIKGYFGMTEVVSERIVVNSFNFIDYLLK
jgi:hypothetical protein